MGEVPDPALEVDADNVNSFSLGVFICAHDLDHERRRYRSGHHEPRRAPLSIWADQQKIYNFIFCTMDKGISVQCEKNPRGNKRQKNCVWERRRRATRYGEQGTAVRTSICANELTCVTIGRKSRRACIAPIPSRLESCANPRDRGRGSR